jgi:hypothetical protein
MIGLWRRWCPTSTGKPAARDVSQMRCACSDVSAIGFSTSTAAPRASASRVTGACRPLGVATTTARGFSCSSSAMWSLKYGTPAARATSAPAGIGSAMATSSTLALRNARSMCVRPI